MDKTRLLGLLAMLLICSNISHAEEYHLAIQPILPQKELVNDFQPLADYLSQATGHTISIHTERNFLFYWTKMRKGREGFDLVLDAAHFTDYRIKNQGYKVLTKFPDTVSFSVVTGEDSFILDAEELIGSRVATLPSPSLGALRLEEMYPNKMRMPHFVWEYNTTVVIEKLRSGEIDAAIIPSRLASTYSDLNIVLTTEPVPHMGLSASPDVPEDVASKIQSALLNADKTPEGKKLLEALRLQAFQPADADTYDGYSRLLEGVFGYKSRVR
jgi:phosphonate transport system substrate-binding protein